MPVLRHNPRAWPQQRDGSLGALSWWSYAAATAAAPTCYCYCYDCYSYCCYVLALCSSEYSSLNTDNSCLFQFWLRGPRAQQYCIRQKKPLTRKASRIHAPLTFYSLHLHERSRTRTGSHGNSSSSSSRSDSAVPNAEQSQLRRIPYPRPCSTSNAFITYNTLTQHSSSARTQLDRTSSTSTTATQHKHNFSHI